MSFSIFQIYAKEIGHRNSTKNHVASEFPQKLDNTDITWQQFWKLQVKLDANMSSVFQPSDSRITSKFFKWNYLFSF